MPPVAPEARGFGQHSVQLDSQSPACMLTCCFPLLLGCEVAVGQRVALSNQKVAFFTWHGATVEVQGKPDIVYVDGGTQLGVLLPCTGSESNRNHPPVGMWLATRPWSLPASLVPCVLSVVLVWPQVQATRRAGEAALDAALGEVMGQIVVWIAGRV